MSFSSVQICPGATLAAKLETTKKQRRNDCAVNGILARAAFRCGAQENSNRRLSGMIVSVAEATRLSKIDTCLRRTGSRLLADFVAEVRCCDGRCTRPETD